MSAFVGDATNFNAASTAGISSIAGVTSQDVAAWENAIAEAQNEFNRNSPSSNGVQVAEAGDIYAVSPATTGSDQRGSNINTWGQKWVHGADAGNYSHLMMEINPDKETGRRQFVDSQPGEGTKIRDMQDVVNHYADRGSTVDRYAPKTQLTQEQKDALTARATELDKESTSWDYGALNGTYAPIHKDQYSCSTLVDHLGSKYGGGDIRDAANERNRGIMTRPSVGPFPRIPSAPLPNDMPKASKYQQTGSDLPEAIDDNWDYVLDKVEKQQEKKGITIDDIEMGVELSQ